MAPIPTRLPCKGGLHRLGDHLQAIVEIQGQFLVRAGERKVAAPGRGEFLDPNDARFQQDIRVLPVFLESLIVNVEAVLVLAGYQAGFVPGGHPRIRPAHDGDPVVHRAHLFVDHLDGTAAVDSILVELVDVGLFILDGDAQPARIQAEFQVGLAAAGLGGDDERIRPVFVGLVESLGVAGRGDGSGGLGRADRLRRRRIRWKRWAGSLLWRLRGSRHRSGRFGWGRGRAGRLDLNGFQGRLHLLDGRAREQAAGQRSGREDEQGDQQGALHGCILSSAGQWCDVR